MLKKIVWGTLLVALIGLLAVGAVVRTLDKTELVAEARGNGRSHEEAAGSAANETSYGQGRGSGGGQGGAVRSQSNDCQDAPGDGAGSGQANVAEWLTFAGSVVSVDADALVVQTSSGELVTVENRAWWFAQEQGFWAEAGDAVTLLGFYEGGEAAAGAEHGFEVGRLENLSSGQTALLRETSGRPLWAGRGRRGG